MRSVADVQQTARISEGGITVSKKLLAIVLMVMMLMSLMVTAIAEEPVEIRIMTGESGDNLA